jgi:hypothetical protein
MPRRIVPAKPFAPPRQGPSSFPADGRPFGFSAAGSSTKAIVYGLRIRIPSELRRTAATRRWMKSIRASFVTDVARQRPHSVRARAVAAPGTGTSQIVQCSRDSSHSLQKRPSP